MSAPIPPVIIVAAIAAIEGIGLVAYAIYDVVEALRGGVSGPEEVSNAQAVIVLIAIQLIFGLGMLWVARGWWLCRRWARSPFIVAQLLGVLVGYELAQSSGGAEKLIGIGLAIVAIVGIVLAFTPAVARAIEP